MDAEERLSEKLSKRADDAQEQISRLRDRVDRLVKDYGPAVSRVASRTGAALSDAGDAAGAQARAVMRDVTPTQIGLMVLALGVGWLIGRTSR